MRNPSSKLLHINMPKVAQKIAHKVVDLEPIWFGDVELTSDAVLLSKQRGVVLCWSRGGRRAPSLNKSLSHESRSASDGPARIACRR